MTVPFDPIETRLGFNDVAIVMAVPLSKDEFLEDIIGKKNGEHRGDYAMGMARRYVDATLDQLWNLAKPSIDLANELISLAKDLGIAPNRLRIHGTLQDLTEVTRANARLIYVIAHWRDDEIFDDDVSGAAQDSLIKYAQQPAAMPRDPGLYDALQTQIYRTGFDPIRNLGTQLTDVYLSVSSVEEKEGRRAFLEHVAGPSLCPGYRLEMRDGMHGARDCAAAVNSDWRGVMDLSICQSIRLAETMKAGLCDRLFFTNVKLKYPARALREVQWLLVNLKDSDHNYRELRMKVHKVFS